MTKQTDNKADNTLYLEIAKNIPEALLVCDKDFKVVFANTLFYKLYGKNTVDICGESLQKIIKNTSNDTCEVCNGHKVDFIGDDKVYHQASLSNYKGKEILIRISHSVIDNGNYYINLLLPLSNLICLNQAQVDFVSTVSHELRTPMTSIKGFADTLLSAGEQLTKEQQTRFISIIKSQADRLTRLVENLLTVSRLEAKNHKSIFKSLNLHYFVDRVVVGLKSKYPHHQFNIQINKDTPSVWADQDKLEQILTNLIDNAAKYSEEGKTVTIKATLCPNDFDKLSIKIIDQGVGIPQEHLCKIFTKFSRIDNPLTRQVQGTGLGLYITKALTDSLGGTINITSDNSGSTFELILLVATPERQAKQGLKEV